MLDYVRNKPKNKFGHHDYEAGSAVLIAEERERFRVFQESFGVVSEI